MSDDRDDNQALIDSIIARQFERLPPHDIGAEQSTLGAMMLDRDVLADVIEILHRDAFFQADHQVIFDMLVAMFARQDGTIDAVTLRAELDKRQLLAEVGGAAYLGQILGAVVSAAHGVHYARIVREKALLRQLIAASNDTLRDAYAPHEQAADVLAKAERRFFLIGESQGGAAGEPTSMRDALVEAFEAAENKGPRGLETGFFDLDERLNGLQNGQMIIVAARPSIGKTALACNLVEHMSVNGNVPGALFSLEMSRREIAARLMCQRAGVDSHKLRKGMLNADEYAKLAVAVGQMQDAPIIVSDASQLTGIGLMGAARRLKRRFGIRYLVIDYLQLMSGAGPRESRQQEISDISRMVKATARELDIPVIALSQLNRQPETRGDRRPRVSDLRESGSLEQDADVVLLLHREDYYRIQEPDFEPDNLAEVIVAKQRNGPTGTIKLTFDSKSTSFHNLCNQPDMF